MLRFIVSVLLLALTACETRDLPVSERVPPPSTFVQLSATAVGTGSGLTYVETWRHVPSGRCYVVFISNGVAVLEMPCSAERTNP